MFCLNDSMRYFLCPGSTDMCKGMFSLSGLIREKMNGDVRNGDVYIFINRLKNRIKLLHAETGGLVMYEKLLEEGTFANLLVVIGATVVYVFQPSAFQDLVECPYRGVVARIA